MAARIRSSGKALAAFAPAYRMESAETAARAPSGAAGLRRVVLPLAVGTVIFASVLLRCEDPPVTTAPSPGWLPCEDYACDSTVVAEVLRANDQEELSVDEVTQLDSSGRVTAVSLSGFAVTQFPGNVVRLQTLRTLDMSSAQLDELPPIVTALANLRTLTLTSNELSTLPSAFADLRELRVLNLRCNLFDDIPRVLGDLPSLAALDLEANRITQLGDRPRGLDSLRHLKLTANRLGALPSWIWDLPALTSVDASHNPVAKIPDFLGRGGRLRNLRMESCHLTALPDDLSSLDSLRALFLAGNRLTELPEAIAALPELTFLSLTANDSLSTLPEAFAGHELPSDVYINYCALCSLSTALCDWLYTRARDEHDMPAFNWRETQNCGAARRLSSSSSGVGPRLNACRIASYVPQGP